VNDVERLIRRRLLVRLSRFGASEAERRAARRLLLRFSSVGHKWPKREELDGAIEVIREHATGELAEALDRFERLEGAREKR